MPQEKLFASARPVPMATETFDSRVRRLEQILAATGGRDPDVPAGPDEPAPATAIKRLAAVSPPLQQFTQEVRSRVGAGGWDAGDILAARLLLEALTSALRSCRVVSDAAAARLNEAQRAVKAGHKFIRREETRQR